MNFITDFADQAVMLPLAIAVAVALALAGWRRGAIAWFAAVPGTLVAVLIAKMVVAACSPWVYGDSGLHSPSGHTASAAVMYGGLAALLMPRLSRRSWALAAAALLAVLFALLFALTRLALHAHTAADVLAGGAIGVAGAIALVHFAGQRPPALRVAIPAAVAVAVLLLFHGQHLRAEDHIDHISRLVWPLTLCVE
jgi:membrane-associated phospholipid phosphatase